MPRRRDKAEPPGSNTIGTIMLLIAAVYAAVPAGRNWPLVAAIAGVGLCFRLMGSGRVYKPAVTRTGDTITCRFNPWREAAFYFVLIGLPLFGIMPLVGSATLGRFSPSFWHILGILLIAGTPVFVFIFMRQSRQSVLRINPSALSVHLPGQQHASTEIPREAVDEISGTTVRMRNFDSAPATQITYQDRTTIPATAQSVVFGPTNTKKTAWLTVEQADLLAGLQAWRGGDPTDPGLMDRIEATLCGQQAG